MGIDYASKNDYFAVVLHQLPEYVQGSNYLPTLKTLRKYPHTNYAEMLQILERDLFRRFPPFYIVPDYTSEKTFTDILIESYGKDAIEMVMAGATAVGIGSGIYYRGILIFKKVCDEMTAWMKKNKVKSLEEIKGCAHK